MQLPDTPPRATMRLQLHKGFTFHDAAPIAPYMARLGISHLYSSPILTARAGSMHGYDVADPTRINPELGGEAGFRAMVAAARAAGLGIIVDIVPNHMAVGRENPWWQDVLKKGRESRFAHVFDIDWNPDNPLLQGKVLLPVLGRAYGEALASGELSLLPGESGSEIGYFDNRFPIRPEDEAEIASLGVGAYTSEDGAGRARLHRLLERQNYRLAFWRTAPDEINWRRFFDINELAGIRAEDERVFEATHATTFRLYAEGLIDAVRVDHVDGLSDPRAYCRRLRTRLSQLASSRPSDAPAGPAWIVVEKILGVGETLAEAWQVDGTSGYDFMNLVSAVQHDPGAAEELAALWAALSGRPAEFGVEEEEARREILERSFAAQLASVVGALHRVAIQDPRTRDISRPAIHRAMVALLAHFPAYRSYATGSEPPASDAEVFARAVSGAEKAGGLARQDVLRQAVAWLRAPTDPARRIAATRFQQLSAPVAAKAVEDTAFYRYGRLISRNDVGFDAACLGIGPDRFHDACVTRAARFPAAMLATATHDHKRGEDVRARLAVLSEMADEWGALLRHWLQRNTRYRDKTGAGPAPSPGDEIMLYQTLLGAWPLQLHPTDLAGREAFGERVAQWQEKALHEAKLRTSWTEPNPEYEAAAQRFLGALIHDDEFVAELVRVSDRIGPAGAVNGLAQTVLKLTVPGVPDFYQGTEFWDQSLVDPDNRRPVDFLARNAAIDAAESPLIHARSWRDGRVKQAVIWRLLAVRSRRPELFKTGNYVPVSVSGPCAQNFIAFARQSEDAALLVIVPRLPLKILDGPEEISMRPSSLDETFLMLPDELANRTLRGVFGDVERRAASRLQVSAVFDELPVAALEG